jgi:pimeloyl-ACP methyl ester carboxylesterase
MPPDEQKEAMQVFAAAREGAEKAVAAWLRLGLWTASRDRPEVMKAIERSTGRSAKAFTMAAPPFVPIAPPASGRLGELRAPTLVVTGDRDTPGNRAAADMLAQGIPGAKLVVIRGADHAIPIGWAKEMNEVALAFLAGL